MRSVLLSLSQEDKHTAIKSLALLLLLGRFLSILEGSLVSPLLLLELLLFLSLPVALFLIVRLFQL